jgi:hypothetical protein
VFTLTNSALPAVFIPFHNLDKSFSLLQLSAPFDHDNGLLFLQFLEQVIKSRIPGIQSLINSSIDNLESELDTLGRPIAGDAGAQLYSILELCRAFDHVFKSHLDGG